MNKVYICIPTYNEAKNITEILDRIRTVSKAIKTHELNVLIIDDNSPDGTAQIVKDYSVKSPLKIHLINNEKKNGLGFAYITGFKFAIKENAEAIMMMDADHSHNPDHIPQFIAKLKTHDFVVGSRYIKGGGVVNWELKRRLISKFGNLYSQIILGVGINDLTGGFNLYKREVLEKVNLDQIHSNGYSFQIELKYKAARKGFKYTEVPIVFKERKHGSSKFDGSIFREAIFTPWKLKFEK